jgi:hypothetical protein
MGWFCPSDLKENGPFLAAYSTRNHILPSSPMLGVLFALQLQAIAVAPQWNVAAALKNHKEEKLAKAIAAQTTARFLIAFSAHQEPGLVDGLTKLLSFALKSQGETRSYDVILFLGGEAELAGKVHKELHEKGFQPIEVVHMAHPPSEYKTPMEIFRNTYMAQEALMDYRLKHTQYQYAWLIEQDVMYTGPWQDFFDEHDNGASSGHDLVGLIRKNDQMYHVSGLLSLCTRTRTDDLITASII